MRSTSTYRPARRNACKELRGTWNENWYFQAHTEYFKKHKKGVVTYVPQKPHLLAKELARRLNKAHRMEIRKNEAKGRPPKGIYYHP